MDLFTFVEQREVDLDLVFNDEDPPPKDPSNVQHLIRKLGHGLEKKINTWWDITTFDRYIKANIVPRRLRWDVPPMTAYVTKSRSTNGLGFLT